MNNLITVTAVKSTVSTFSGWFVTMPNGQISIEGLGKLSASPYIEEKRKGYRLLHAAAIKKEMVERTIEHREEDDPFVTETSFKEIQINILPEPDEKSYYRIFLDDSMALSEDFDVLLDTHIEDSHIEGVFSRVVYASLPKDLPLVLDSKGTLCVSPI